MCSPTAGAAGVGGAGGEALSPATACASRVGSPVRDIEGCSACEGEPLPRSASSSSTSRGVAGAAPFCAALACLRRRPPRRPRRRLPVPAASAPAAGVAGASPPATTFSMGLVASISVSGAAAGFAVARPCVSWCGAAVVDSSRVGFDSCARKSVAGFDAVGATGFCAARAWRCGSSPRDLFDLAGEPFGCCWPCWRPRRDSPSRSRSWLLRRARDPSARRSEGRSRRWAWPDGDACCGCVSSASAASGAGAARNQPNRRPSKPPEAAAGVDVATAGTGAGDGAVSSRCGIGVTRWMPLTAGSSPWLTTPIRGCGAAATSVRRS